MISFSSSSRFPLSSGEGRQARNVSTGPRKAGNETAADRISSAMTMGIVAVACLAARIAVGQLRTR